jgi:hypothetical protein
MGIALATRRSPDCFRRARQPIPASVGAAPHAFEAVITGGLGSLWARSRAARRRPGADDRRAHRSGVDLSAMGLLIVLVIRPRGLFPRAVD